MACYRHFGFRCPQVREYNVTYRDFAPVFGWVVGRPLVGTPRRAWRKQERPPSVFFISTTCLRAYSALIHTKQRRMPGRESDQICSRCCHRHSVVNRNRVKEYRHDHRWPQRTHAGRRWFGECRSVGAQGDGRPRQARDDDTGGPVAAGYAACFGGALDYVATQQKKSARQAQVTCSVTIGRRTAGGFGLAVKLLVADSSLPQQELEALAREAHEKVCPYSHATRGNVDVQLEVKGA